MFIPSKFSAFHDETGRLNVDGMNIISNDGSNKLNRSRKARVSYKVQRTINASLNAATSTRAVSSNPNFVTRQKIEIIDRKSGSAGMPRPTSYAVFSSQTLDIFNQLHPFPTRRSSDLRLNVDGMNIISNDGSNKLNRSRKARVSYKVQRTINASLNAATSTRAVSSNPNFVTRQKIEIIFG